jgi:alkylhydroperoxidase family enzyme
LRVEHNDSELVEAIKRRRWRELLHLTPRQRALCTLAEKMTLTPREMTA